MMLKLLRPLALVFLLIVFLSSAIMSLARLQDPLPPWIAFSRLKDGNNEIYRMRFDGSNQQLLARYPSRNSFISWRPDEGRIIFASSSMNSVNIYQISPNVSNFESGTKKAISNVYNMQRIRDALWSPNGDWILFESQRDLHRMRPDGSDLQNLTADQGSYLVGDWSPDSRQIVAIFRQSDIGYIYRMNADGSEQVALARVNALSRPTWSPDGQWILFTSNQDGPRKLYRMRPDGSEQSPYLEHLEHVWEVRWAADNQHLILNIWEDIYRYNIETDELIQLTDDGSSFSPAPSPIIDLPWRAGVMLLFSLALFAFTIPPQALYKSLKRR